MKKSVNLKSLQVSLVLQAILQLVIGCILVSQYKPGAEAYDSIRAIREVPLMDFVSGLHYWGSALLIVSSFIALFWGLLAGEFRDRAREWYGVTLMFLAAYGAQITGNILPMDRHGVQTANIETGLISSIPGVGPSLHQMAIGGNQLSYGTGSLWFKVHEIAITILIVAAILLLANPVKRMLKEATWKLSAGLIILLAAVAGLIAPPLGYPAASADFNQYQAFVSWYTWPLHGLNEGLNKVSPSLGWVGFAVIPGLFVLVLLALPLFGKRIKLAIGQAIPVCFALVFAICGLAFGGPIAKLTGNRDPDPIKEIKPVQSVSPETLNLAKLGRDLFNSEGCAGCHGQNGEKGTIGPTLTQEGSSETSGWVAKFIRNPKSFRPNTTMPSFSTLTNDQANQLATWVTLPPDLKQQVIQKP